MSGARRGGGGGIGGAPGSGGNATVPAVVTGGTTYTLAATDALIIFDSSNGSQPVAQMISASYLGQKWTFWWEGFPSPVTALPKIVAPGAVLIMPFNGQPSSGTTGWATSTVLSTPGATWTVMWDGTELIAV
jgi:hypothetical protein